MPEETQNISNEEKEFLEKFKICPTCGDENDEEFLLDLYRGVNFEVSPIFKQLIEFWKSNKNNPRIKTGIPCCYCYAKYFSDEIEVEHKEMEERIKRLVEAGVYDWTILL